MPPPGRVAQRIELYRPLDAPPGAVLDAIRQELVRIGCTIRRSSPDAVEFDGLGVSGLVGHPVDAGTLTLDLAVPSRAALWLELSFDPWRTYGWAAAAALAVAAALPG